MAKFIPLFNPEAFEAFDFKGKFKNQESFVKTKWLDGELWTDEKAVAAMEAGFNEQGQAMYEVLKQLRLVGPESISTGEEYSGNCLRIEDLGMMSANVKQKNCSSALMRTGTNSLLNGWKS